MDRYNCLCIFLCMYMYLYKCLSIYMYLSIHILYYYIYFLTYVFFRLFMYIYCVIFMLYCHHFSKNNMVCDLVTCFIVDQPFLLLSFL